MTETAHFLGINGLTIGGAGIWTLVVLALGAVLRQWIAGRADMKRAETESMNATDKVEQDAKTKLFDRMEAQMARMEGEIEGLRTRVAHLEEQARQQAERERILLEENTLLRIDSALNAKPRSKPKAVSA
ncbi:MAG: hypothetical protein V4657_09460 [Pseudomonadota bacterium]